ncbi:heme A synthase [Pedobacter sp. HMF7647]|uniref:Heme A synthase n=1 Tax=Hufsiella arboris TaxID=2695275 RepID=A0A7K1Y488_9SPHI|nr:COX15/CtaA family protein [Hufsiella arboris]MXV49397.1 heme A synthase [Hufsiella arboris]
MYPSSEKRFLIVNMLAIISLFLVILAGGIVRSSGSGMGCPDWPKCFDRYVPPTSIEQLPEGYKERYVAKRVAKNNRFAKMLDMFGYRELAQRIRDDKSILEPEAFNAGKTWTEYVNRLVGALSGLFLIACLIFSVTYLKSRKRIFLLSFANLILVGFQGWLGSIVVSTNLLAWVVTVHMLLALLIIGISIYTFFQARMLRDRNLLASKPAKNVRVFAIAAFAVTIIQIILGSEVRESIDAIADSMGQFNRSEWVAKVGTVFNVHRDLALLVFILNSVTFFMIRGRYVLNGMQFRYASVIMLVLLLQIITGIVLAYLALPAVAQAIHIFLATLLFGAQLYLLLLLKRNKLYRKLAR